MNLIGKGVTRFYEARQSLAQVLHGCSYPDNDAARKLAEDGVVIFEQLMPRDLLEMVADVNRGRFDYTNAADTVFSPDGVKIQSGASVSAAEFAKYYFLHIKRYSEKLDIYNVVDPLVRPVLSAYYRSNYYYRELDCYRSQPVAEAFQGSYAWHRDNYPPGSLKVMVYMTDVTDVADGPLVVAKGSHKGFHPELGLYGPRVPREEVEGKLELIRCTGRRGTVILFNNNSVHRATNPTRGYREVLNSLILPKVTGFKPAVLGTDADAKPAFLQKYTR